MIKLIIDNRFINNFIARKNNDYYICMNKYNEDIYFKLKNYIKEEYSMRNRILLLCLKNHIETVIEYADKLHISEEYAEDILKENAILTDDLIEANCKLFDVSREYLLCEV